MWWRCWRCGVCRPAPSPAQKRRPFGADPHPLTPSPAPAQPPTPGEGEWFVLKRETKKHVSFFSCFWLTSPSSPGVGGGRGREKRAGVMRVFASAILVALLLILLLPAPARAADRIVVGSKNFEESRLLAEMFAQLLESRTGLQVERRLGLAGTQVCFEALKNGAIDVYPEYTGTGLVSILNEKVTGSPA